MERAMDFLPFARVSSFMPMKIAMYIPVLESLFSESDGDISFKVSERCACYLGGTQDEKMAIFKTVRRSYDLRSKLLHGSQVDPSVNNPEDQIKLSIEIDEVVRRILKQAILIDHEKFRKGGDTVFYNELLFT
ncbi:MAG: hypothetical protein LH478_08210 [Chitinophagaceae bacterium]|nr:hypothetical protein [Chitinophagaceae bacterium]